MTANEYIKKYTHLTNEELLIGFAKYHVEQANKQTQLCIRVYDRKGNTKELKMGEEITTERENEYVGILENNYINNIN